MIKYKVKYLTKKKPRITVIIKRLAHGSWLMYCDFDERYAFDSVGYFGDGQSIFFSNDNELLIEVSFRFPWNCLIFGEMSKRTFHALIIANRVYDKLMGDE